MMLSIKSGELKEPSEISNIIEPQKLCEGTGQALMGIWGCPANMGFGSKSLTPRPLIWVSGCVGVELNLCAADDLPRPFILFLSSFFCLLSPSTYQSLPGLTWLRRKPVPENFMVM